MTRFVYGYIKSGMNMAGIQDNPRIFFDQTTTDTVLSDCQWFQEFARPLLTMARRRNLFGYRTVDAGEDFCEARNDGPGFENRCRDYGDLGPLLNLAAQKYGPMKFEVDDQGRMSIA
jgi:hypothetical protein